MGIAPHFQTQNCDLRGRSSAETTYISSQFKVVSKTDPRCMSWHLFWHISWHLPWHRTFILMNLPFSDKHVDIGRDMILIVSLATVTSTKTYGHNLQNGFWHLSRNLPWHSYFYLRIYSDDSTRSDGVRSGKPQRVRHQLIGGLSHCL